MNKVCIVYREAYTLQHSQLTLGVKFNHCRHTQQSHMDSRKALSLLSLIDCDFDESKKKMLN